MLILPLPPSDRPDSPDCPAGSAACVVTTHGSFNMGSPTKQLELLSSDRYLHDECYTRDSNRHLTFYLFELEQGMICSCMSG